MRFRRWKWTDNNVYAWKLVKGQTLLQCTHNCGSVGLPCCLEHHWAWTFSSSWQISLGFSRPPCSSTSHNLRPNLCAAPWQSAPALLQVTRIKNCRLERVRNRHMSQFVLMSLFSVYPCRLRIALTFLYFPDRWLCLQQASTRYRFNNIAETP